MEMVGSTIYVCQPEKRGHLGHFMKIEFSSKNQIVMQGCYSQKISCELVHSKVLKKVLQVQ